MAVENASESDSTSVHVAVRVRPQSAKEKLAMNQICTAVASNAPQLMLGKDSSFTFDYVFNIHSTQEQIFQTLAKPLIDGCMNGYNATILAYGQTGSGKTYTMGTGFDMSSGHHQAGIIPRAVQYLFASIAESRAQAAAKHEPVPEFKVVAQFLELYNEELVDLLDADRSRKSHLRLHENAQGDIYLTGVSTRLVSSLEDTLKCLRDGSLVRSTASTNMNAQSSRSHAIFTLHIRQQRLVKYEEESSGPKGDSHSENDQDPDSTVTVPEFETLTAKFHFVDLAGSERLKRTGATGDRAKEGISINRGLLALGNVISALGDKAKRGCHVPYRDSKLTRLLQDSLGGNSRTIMIACISPSDCDFLETLNTLKYANRARNIRNKVMMNQDKTSKQLAMLRAQLAALQEEIEEYRQGKRVAGTEETSDLSREIALYRQENDKLRLRVKALTVTIDALKVRNAQLSADQEAGSWATSRARLLQAAQGDQPNPDSTSAKTVVGSDTTSANLIMEEMDSFRQLVEKYTIENEELRTKLVEAEALAEFGQHAFSYASPGRPGRLSDGILGGAGRSSSPRRVALTSSEFPDLDSSMVAAAEAGLSVANYYFDMDPEAEATVATVPGLTKKRKHHRHRQKHRGRHQKPCRLALSEERKALNDVTNNGEPKEAWTSGANQCSEARGNSKALKRTNGQDTSSAEMRGAADEAADLVSLVLNGEAYADLDEDGGANEGYDDGEQSDVSNTCAVEPTDGTAAELDETLLADQPQEDTLSHAVKPKRRARSNDETASEFGSSSGSSDSEGSDNDSTKSDTEMVIPRERDVRETEKRLHVSLANVSNAIDSKQRLLAELQAKAAQLDSLRRHYERQLNNLQSRIRETEKERDSVMANLDQVEHAGEERLRKTKEEFAKKLNSLQDEVKHLQTSRQEQLRLEREQAKKNGELRQLRAELENLRRLKVTLTQQLQKETNRARQLEALSARRVLELKKAKSQADSHIRSLEAAQSAKERALKQKEAEVEALKRKTIEQQRQLVSSASNRMTRSVIVGGSSSVASRRADERSFMSTSVYPSNRTGNLTRNRFVNTAKAKWTMINRQLEIEIQRRQTAARLEHDMQTWVRERDNLSRRLQRLQRRRARAEESVADNAEDENSHLAEFDEQIRNVTAQLDSAQEAIRDCQASIIELDKCAPKAAGVVAPRTRAPNSRSATGANATQLLFSGCSLSESRFLLNQLFENAVSRALQASRLQLSEAQLRANLSVWEQEREQELEVLRIAMQHAGIPMESIEAVLSVAGNGDRPRSKSTTVCPQHGSLAVAGCECCSLTGEPPSAPISSDESSDEDNHPHSDHGTSLSIIGQSMAGQSSYHPCQGMSHSMYASLEASNVNKSRITSELDESSDRTCDGTLDGTGRPVKARGRMLQPQDMLGLSTPLNTNSSNQAADSTLVEMMPPPGSYFLRRPRTAFGPAMSTAIPATPRLTPVPLSAGPSPATRRRFPGCVLNNTSVTNNGPTSTTTRAGLQNVQNIPSAMSMSVTLPVGGSDSQNGNIDIRSRPVSAAASSSPVDVFNRLTSGMFNSPHPSRGSIQPLQKCSSLGISAAPSSPTPVMPGNAVSVLHTPSQPYRLASSGSAACSTNLTVATNNVPAATLSQPLAAFFGTSTASTQPPVVSSGSNLLGSPGLSAPSNQPPSFRVPMECTHIARGHSNAVLDVDIIGNIMVTGSKDRTAKVWDLQTMEEIDTLKDHPNNVSKVRLCPVTNLIFTVCSYFIKVWDRRDPRKCIRTLLSSGLNQDGELEMKITRRQNICPPGETNIMDIALGGPHPSLTHTMLLATANSVKLWDLRRYFAVGKLHGNHQAPVMVLATDQTPYSVSCSSPQLTVVTGSKDHYIKVFHVAADASGLLTPTFDLEPPHYDGIESLVLHGNTLFSGSRDAAIKKWNLGRDGRQEVMLAQAHKDWIQGLAITGDGKNLISGCRGGHLKLWNVEDCTCLGEVLNAHEGAINAVRAVDDRIFTAGSDKDVRFWHLLDQNPA
ncbi:unnamed protein product [Calicophoron daubneyi]|uniref:Kinesin motor domain-containing protein n=1 Tax=Calicophoron daubneyi TaxID=300641 RepID=A0AAV2TWX6_CALDB